MPDTMAPNRFTDIITTPDVLRDVLGSPHPRIVAKVITYLDAHCRTFISGSPFVLIASANGHGKGDPPGFVYVLDDQTLAIPERPGNRLADTLLNILASPQVALLFMIPGKAETLRAGGRAQIVRDGWLLEKMAVKGIRPLLATVVTVDRVFFHCAKCVIRSKLWQQDAWPDLAGMPTLAQAIIDHAKLTESVQQVQAGIDESYRDRLY